MRRTGRLQISESAAVGPSFIVREKLWLISKSTSASTSASTSTQD